VNAETRETMVELPIVEFVPHAGPMLLPDRVVSLQADSAVCEWCVRDDNIFLVPGFGVPAYIGIEYMAQCIAVHGGAHERANGFPPPRGLLLGTRHYHSTVPYFVPGETYRVKCRQLLSNLDGMTSFDCAILSGADVIAEGRISVLQESRGDSFHE
jgi:predicted hotdog family 3-hydroxylacyl-ACP dehydratase